MNEKIESICTIVSALSKGDRICFQGIGKNGDLNVTVYKDAEFDSLYDLFTKKNGIAVDDAVGVHEDSLADELIRIWNEENMRLL